VSHFIFLSIPVSGRKLKIRWTDPLFDPDGGDNSVYLCLKIHSQALGNLHLVLSFIRVTIQQDRIRRPGPRIRHSGESRNPVQLNSHMPYVVNNYKHKNGD
ncbi:MAG: hypothetical protein ABR542_00790, partial [Desulfonatronovibrio sp.]